MNAINFTEVKAKSVSLMNAHKEYLSKERTEQEIENLYYSNETPKTRLAMIEFFDSFSEVKLSVKDAMEFNEICGFSSEYKDLMKISL